MEVMVCDPLGKMAIIKVSQASITGREMKELIQNELDFSANPSTLFFNKTVIQDDQRFKPNSAHPYIITSGNFGEIAKKKRPRFGNFLKDRDRFSYEEVYQNKILTMNNFDNHDHRNPFRYLFGLNSSDPSELSSSDTYSDSELSFPAHMELFPGLDLFDLEPISSTSSGLGAPMDFSQSNPERGQQEANSHNQTSSHRNEDQNHGETMLFNIQYTPEESETINSISDIYPQFSRVIIIQVFEACSRNEEETIRCLSTM